MGSFCAVRAHVYHDLFHYKRRVCMVLARHLRAAMHTHPNANDAIAAVLEDEDMVNGLRLGLTTLCSAAQSLQIGQGTAQRFQDYGEGQGAVRQAARHMGARVEQCGDLEDWAMADRGLVSASGGDGDRAEGIDDGNDDEGNDDEGNDDEGNDDDEVKRSAGGRRAAVLLSSDEEPSTPPRATTACVGTQTCDVMHHHALAILSARLKADS